MWLSCLCVYPSAQWSMSCCAAFKRPLNNVMVQVLDHQLSLIVPVGFLLREDDPTRVFMNDCEEVWRWLPFGLMVADLDFHSETRPPV